MKKPRSIQQNKAMHKLFNEVSNELISQGIDQRAVLMALEGYACPVTPEFLKEVWRSIMFTMFRKTSTTQLTTKEMTDCYEVFNKFLGENFGVHLDFPCWNNVPLEELDI